MLDRQRGMLVAECDECDEVLETEESDFQDAWRKMKNDGWTAKNEAGVWMHQCPKCSGFTSPRLARRISQ